MKSRLCSLMLAAPFVAAVTLSATTLQTKVAFADDACGTKENPCPLQKWMRQNMAPAVAAGDNAGLAAALDKVAKISPDASWSTWGTLSKQGSDAAKKGDLAGAKASCKGCHDAYKDKYKAQYRTKTAPQ
jgi:hypothetical protein